MNKEFDLEKHENGSESKTASSSTLNEEILHLSKTWRIGSDANATKLKAVLDRLTPIHHDEVFCLGKILRNKAGEAEWAIIVQEYFESYNVPMRLEILGVIMGYGHAPLIKTLISGSLDDFIEFVTNSPMREANSILKAMIIFVESDGLKSLNVVDCIKVREFFVEMFRKGQPRIKGKRLFAHLYKQLALTGIEQIGTGSDLECLVQYIGQLGNRMDSRAYGAGSPS